MNRCDISDLSTFVEQLRLDLAVFEAFEEADYGEWLPQYLDALERYIPFLPFLAPIPPRGGGGMTGAQFLWIRRRLAAILVAGEGVLRVRRELDAAEDRLADALAEFGPPHERRRTRPAGARTAAADRCRPHEGGAS